MDGTKQTSSLKLILGILSAALICYQIQLIHFFSFTQWHHFAYMIISMALLGYGSAASLVMVHKKALLRHFYKSISFFLLCCSLLMVLAPILASYNPVQFDSYQVFAEKWHWVKLLATYLIFLMPFMAGAMVLALVYTKYRHEAGKYYFADLTGAGLGSCLALVLFSFLKPQQIFPAIASLPLIAGVIATPRNRIRILALGGVLVGTVLITSFIKPFKVQVSQFKSISKALQLSDAKIIEESNSPFGWIQILSSPQMRYAPGLSLQFKGEVPRCDQLFINGNWHGALIPYTDCDTFHILDETPRGLAYSLGRPPRVLIVNSQTGLELTQALIHKAPYIQAIEPIPVVWDKCLKHIPLLSDSSVHHLSMEPRTYLARNKETFDLIVFPTTGVFGGNMGMGAMAEEPLLTVEAFEDAFKSLSAQGIMQMECFLDYPPKTAYKLAVIIAEMLHQQGIDTPANHVAVIRSWNTLSFHISKTPWSPEVLDRIHVFAEEKGFEALTHKGKPTDELAERVEEILRRKNRDIVHQYAFNIKAPTDNKPYFSQFIKWKSIPLIIKQYGGFSTLHMEMGYVLLLLTAVQILILSLVLVLVPLKKGTWEGRKNAWLIFYFIGLGFGFMFFEILMIKYMLIYLGIPEYSVSFVLAVLLVCSGWGSYFSGTFKGKKLPTASVIRWVCLYLLFEALFMGFILESTLSVSRFLQLAISVLILGVPGFFMGMLFPRGLQQIPASKQEWVPWAYGLNTLASVLATCVAAILCVEIGYPWVLACGVGFYLMALLGWHLKLSQKVPTL